MIGRPCHLGEIAFVSATPESTPRAEKKPRMAEKSDERRRQPAQLGYLFGGSGHPEKDSTTRDSPPKCRFGGDASVLFPVEVFVMAHRKPMAEK